jgi:hypothetical protein
VRLTSPFPQCPKEYNASSILVVLLLSTTIALQLSANLRLPVSIVYSVCDLREGVKVLVFRSAGLQKNPKYHIKPSSMLPMSKPVSNVRPDTFKMRCQGPGNCQAHEQKRNGVVVGILSRASLEGKRRRICLMPK